VPQYHAISLRWSGEAQPIMPPTGWFLGDLATTIAPYDPLIKGQVLDQRVR